MTEEMRLEYLFRVVNQFSNSGAHAYIVTRAADEICRILGLNEGK